MIEGLEREAGRLRQGKEEGEERERFEQEKRDADKRKGERETKRATIMDSTAAGQPSFAAKIQMKR
jgi:hypothetical protein